MDKEEVERFMEKLRKENMAIPLRYGVLYLADKIAELTEALKECQRANDKEE